jgi:exonuclease III
MIFLSETHLTNDITDNEIKIKGYYLIRADTNNNRTGGVAVYMRNSIKNNVVNCDIINCDIKLISVKLENYIEDTIFTLIYNSPSFNKSDFFNYLENFMTDKLDNTMINVMCGDFNFALLKNDCYSKKMKDLIKKYGLKQLIKEPTRTPSKTSMDNNG